MFQHQTHNSQTRKHSISTQSTDLDSSFQTPNPQHPQKLKTQLCKTFSLIGSCPYGIRCRFAHGSHELVKLTQEQKKKHRNCIAFWKKGVCPYGSRCQFGHEKMSWQTKACLLGLQALSSIEENSWLRTQNVHLW